MNTRGGFLKILVVVIIGIAILAYFKVDFRQLVHEPWVQGAWHLVQKYSLYAWEHVLRTPTMYVYNEWVISYIWPTVLHLFDLLKAKLSQY